MPRVSTAFFAVGVVYVLIGMLWGMDMGASGNHAALPAHAHLNLLGWVTMALYGTFYALARGQYSTRLAWTNFVLSNIGVIIMIPFLARLLLTGARRNGSMQAMTDLVDQCMAEYDDRGWVAEDWR